MGLDNGLILKIKQNSELSIPKDIQDKHDSYFDTKDYKAYELSYWRKCWQLRDDIIEHIEIGQNGGEYNLNKKQLKALISLLEYYYLDYFGLKTWSTKGMYYWDEPDTNNSIMYFVDRIKLMKKRKSEGKIIINQLRWVLKHLDEKQIKVIFYDSY